VSASPLEYVEGVTPQRDALVRLYDAVGWSAYTANPDQLVAAVDGSAWVLTAWDDGALVGLIRAVSDDASIAYLQDVLVQPSHHRRGIGRVLVTRFLERFEHVRQRILLTDDRPEQHAFYASLGFSDTRALTKVQLHTFVSYRGLTLE